MPPLSSTANPSHCGPLFGQKVASSADSPGWPMRCRKALSRYSAQSSSLSGERQCNDFPGGSAPSALSAASRTSRWSISRCIHIRLAAGSSFLFDAHKRRGWLNLPTTAHAVRRSRTAVKHKVSARAAPPQKSQGQRRCQLPQGNTKCRRYEGHSPDVGKSLVVAQEMCACSCTMQAAVREAYGQEEAKSRRGRHGFGSDAAVVGGHHARHGQLPGAAPDVGDSKAGFAPARTKSSTWLAGQCWRCWPCTASSSFRSCAFLARSAPS